MYSFDPVSGSNVPFTAVWSQCPTGAMPLGVHHQYGSYNWTRPVQYSEEVGEVITGSRPYGKGATPPGLVGTNHCGTQWTGKLERLTVPLPNSPNGQPTCCTLGPVLSCPQCPAGAPWQWHTVNIFTFTGALAVFNGTWIMKYVLGCQWSNGGDPVSVGFLIDIFGNCQLTFHDAATGNNAIYKRTGHLCMTNNFCNYASSIGSGTHPANLVVFPN
jgi:hypothetical protein